MLILFSLAHLCLAIADYKRHSSVLLSRLNSDLFHTPATTIPLQRFPMDLPSHSGFMQKKYNFHPSTHDQLLNYNNSQVGPQPLVLILSTI
ncbi:MAG: uncharacterized protein KVP18_000239 [Porospora cf. gigantea A]|uniref:uncharacterized protein n=1 Tax=Porospora cf. gigantea A TaxID=2853593 RepID=UPI003559B737|nr:MAG: hypothetical protein KVP18_000239 [Porospora cf. gigantea A]